MPAITFNQTDLLASLGFQMNPASITSSICARCGSSNVIAHSDEDEAGHAESWVECRECGSDDVIESEVL